ncbi:MAG: MATE family efflux transporter [Butyrivibrio sp.]|uniref:MATE family efflux transporter n=1 Tax=Butyrivibrio sp. TaxID=28121 RepID=UPI001B1006FF|nr:MATE family efflux transporter [Butyrivibrio sp.]MBO6242592.1 MATE family efflux transporter [Butyrivibrio sp.]
MNEKNSIITGNLWTSILKYLAPLLLSMLIQQSYQTIDAIIIGQGSGSRALGAIDSTYGFIKLLINSSITLTSAASVLVSKSYGAGNIAKVKNYIRALALSSFAIGIIISISQFFLTAGICDIMNVPEEMVKDASLYTGIYLGGAVFMMLYNCGASILKSIGNSVFPSNVLMISSILNVLLDLIFIYGLHMGVAGVAIATVISQAISAVLVLTKLLKLWNSFETKEQDRHSGNPMLESIKDILAFGMPAAAQSILFSFSNIYMQSAINKCGTTVVSAWAVCGKLDFLIWIIADALSITAATFIAQNLGAGKRDRVRRARNHIVLIFVMIIGLISVLLYAFTPVLSKIFIKDKDVIEGSVMLMRLIAPFYVTCIGAELFSGILRGYGDPLKPAIFTLIGTVGGRVLWIVACDIARHSGINWIILAYPFSWILTTILFLIYGLYRIKFLTE